MKTIIRLDFLPNGEIITPIITVEFWKMSPIISTIVAMEKILERIQHKGGAWCRDTLPSGIASAAVVPAIHPKASGEVTKVWVLSNGYYVEKVVFSPQDEWGNLDFLDGRMTGSLFCHDCFKRVATDF